MCANGDVLVDRTSATESIGLEWTKNLKTRLVLVTGILSLTMSVQVLTVGITLKNGKNLNVRNPRT